MQAVGAKSGADARDFRGSRPRRRAQPGLRRRDVVTSLATAAHKSSLPASYANPSIHRTHRPWWGLLRCARGRPCAYVWRGWDGTSERFIPGIHKGLVQNEFGLQNTTDTDP